ncbi:hypothetical protein LB503_007019 [Fusarium chuoi]|nr:hypothetical protein LB503_007019 [Fusarium chuoi]
MVAVLRNRLPGNKLLRIAKALGEIRPSFISCTKDLTRQDLIFMEKCFQRTLVEYDDFLQHCCAPTIVCRRSGEVAAVNKELDKRGATRERAKPQYQYLQRAFDQWVEHTRQQCSGRHANAPASKSHP